MTRVADGLSVSERLLGYADDREALLAKPPAERRVILAEARTTRTRLEQRLEARRRSASNPGAWRDLAGRAAYLLVGIVLLLAFPHIVASILANWSMPFFAMQLGLWVLAAVVGVVIMTRAVLQVTKQRAETLVLRTWRSQLNTVIRTAERSLRASR